MNRTSENMVSRMYRNAVWGAAEIIREEGKTVAELIQTGFAFENGEYDGDGDYHERVATMNELIAYIGCTKDELAFDIGVQLKLI